MIYSILFACCLHLLLRCGILFRHEDPEEDDCKRDTQTAHHDKSTAQEVVLATETVTRRQHEGLAAVP